MPTDFIAELIRAANERSHRTSEELMKLAEMVIDGVPDVLVAHGMLEGADAIRRLKLLNDASQG
jgi:hypothetical protein